MYIHINIFININFSFLNMLINENVEKSCVWLIKKYMFISMMNVCMYVQSIITSISLKFEWKKKKTIIKSDFFFLYSFTSNEFM